jgi:hypothetical protein
MYVHLYLYIYLYYIYAYLSLCECISIKICVYLGLKLGDILDVALSRGEDSEGKREDFYWLEGKIVKIDERAYGYGGKKVFIYKYI